MSHDEHILATLSISPGRRWFALGVVGLLSVLLLSLAMQSGTSFNTKIIFAIAGALTAWGAFALYKSTKHGLVLTDDALITTQGETIALLSDIQRVERGAFAFKPSGGFMLRLNEKASRRWVPGLWWRFGRIVGVGGATSAGQAKAMADILAAKITMSG